MFQSYNQWILTYDLDSIKKCGYGKMFLGIEYLQKSTLNAALMAKLLKLKMMLAKKILST